MGFWFHGIKLTDDVDSTGLDRGVMMALNSGQQPSVQVHRIYGTNRREIEISGMEGDSISIDLILSDKWSSTFTETQHVISLLRGLVSQLKVIYLYDDDRQIFEDSKGVFVVIQDIQYDYQAGLKDADAVATVTLKAEVVGTVATYDGKIIPTAVQRNSDFDGTVQPRSVLGLPKGSTNSNVAVLETRLTDTPVLNLGDGSTGFADDSLASVEGEAQTGKVTYDISVASHAFLSNACKVYDEGYSPRRQITSLNHVYTGNAVIETDLYKVTVNLSTQRFNFALATSPGTYAATFETLELRGFTKIVGLVVRDEMIRLKTNGGDIVEVERGKDPLVYPKVGDDEVEYFTGAINGNNATSTGYQYDFATYDNGKYSELQTQSFSNYVELGDTSGVYASSNYNFTIIEGTRIFKVTTSPVPTDVVYQIHKGTITSTGRNREVLKEIVYSR